MGFNAFQTATATLKKITKDGFGDETVASSFTVEIDPVLGKRRVYTMENEEITGRTTIISPHDSIDVSHDRWDLEYDGRNYQIEQLTPFYTIGTNTLEHVEAVLR